MVLNISHISHRMLRHGGAALCGAVLSLLGMAPQDACAEYGTNSYSFLDVPTSAHGFALGGSAIALVHDDITLVDMNPGLLGPEIEERVAVNYMRYLGSGNFAGVRFARAHGEHGAWAAGIRYLNFGDIPGYTPDGTSTGTFSPQDIVVEGSYSHDFSDRLRGGINMKMIYSDYDVYNAFALATDLGLNYYDDESDLSLSAVLKNAGGQLKRFDQAYNRLPLDLQLGYMQGVGTTPFSIAITASHLTRWDLPYYKHLKSDPDAGLQPYSSFWSNAFRHLTFGMQYNPSEKFYIAGSYSYKTRTDMMSYQSSVLSGVNVGVGLRAGSWSFDVAYGAPHKNASTLLLNISCNLPDLLY